MTKIAIIQRVLPHYRIPFFLELHKKLMHDGIDLELFYGQEFPGSVPKTVTIDVPWAHYIQNRYLKFKKIELVWQSCLNKLNNSDLIIVENANKLILNYILITRRIVQKSHLAYWGHGGNMQEKGSATFREWFKGILMGNVDWWFAYTSISAEAVKNKGFSKEKITVVQNSIDSKDFFLDLQSINEEKLFELCKAYNISTDDNICIYCGGLYSNKKLDFLIESCDMLSERVPNFHLFVLGDGPERTKIERASKVHDWLHFVGPMYGKDRAVYFKLAKAFLMPGLVGLAIIDSFVAKTPLFTTNNFIHSPEIAYLQHGINGFMAEYSIESYVNAVSTYLLSDAEQDKLMMGCAKSAEEYSIENMVNNFAAGILKCLESR